MIVYFLHIPKTSGTSFSRFLDSQFDPARILPPKTWNQYHDQGPLDVSRVGLLRGHFGVGARHMFSAPLTMFTLLRDPVERTLSQYNHLRIDRKYNNWAPEDIPLPPIEEAMDHPFWQAFFSNTQTRYLGLDVNPIPHLRPGFLFDSWENFLHPNESIERIFAQASLRLTELAAVGTQERLDDTLRYLCERFDWPYSPPEPAMILPGRLRQEDLDPSVIRKIRALNAADQELHAQATRILDRKRAELRKALTLPPDNSTAA